MSARSEEAASAKGAPDRNMTASSSVVLHLQVDDAMLNCESDNYEREFLNYDPVVTVPNAYVETDTFRAAPEEVLGPDLGLPGLPGLPALQAGAHAAVLGSFECGFASAAPHAPYARDTHAPHAAALPLPKAGAGRGGAAEKPVAFFDSHDLAAAPHAPHAPTPRPSDGFVSYAKRVTSVLHEFEEKSKGDEWPMSTRTACYWCCHGFEGPPVALPVKHFRRSKEAASAAPSTDPPDSGFCGTGCFCGIPCAAAFNLESNESHEVVCARHTMLCELSRAVLGTDRVKAAPPRTALIMFGGYMGVEAFRAASQTGTVFLENMPPMRSLSQQIEEVDENDVSGAYSFVPLDRGRAERGAEELSLRRNKPLLSGKHTLDHAMRIQFT